MSPLISLHCLSKSYGAQTLFQGLTFSLLEGDQVGLGGPNGAGKSTLLKILYGLENPDEGSISKKQGLRLSYVSQFPEFESLPLDELLVKEVSHLEFEEALLKAQIFLDKAGFKDPKVLPSSLSGGWKKRLDVVRAWMNEPDLVLLDEPTNHLDLEGIEWLENFLLRSKTAFLTVSHDRQFMQNVCRKVAEISPRFPEGIFICKGGWYEFVEKKEAFLAAQREKQRSLQGTVKEELDWLRRSPKARTTKSKSRVDKAHEMIKELSEVRQRNVDQRAQLSFTGSERKTRKLLVATNLEKKLGGKTLFSSLDLKLSPGMRLGIVGKNGTGKTTLLKILAGELKQDQGTIKYAEGVCLVYFDQHRQKLDPKDTLRKALCPSGEFVRYRGEQIHVNGWAQRFLFEPDRLNMPVERLSGGERARILMARLMLEPADVLFLDEPTNDLDIPTLEVIEESLRNFPGSLVLITHDRFLMDKVCTEILVLGESNQPQIYADTLQWKEAQVKPEKKRKPKKQTGASSKEKKRLSYKEQKELSTMEQSIEALEKEIASLTDKANEASEKGLESHSLYENLGIAQEKLDTLYQRWQYLLDASE